MEIFNMHCKMWLIKSEHEPITFSYFITIITYFRIICANWWYYCQGTDRLSLWVSEGILGRLIKQDIVDPVGLVVVAREHDVTHHSSLNGELQVGEVTMSCHFTRTFNSIFKTRILRLVGKYLLSSRMTCGAA